MTPIEYYLIRSLMYRKYEKKRRKLQKKRYKKAKRQYNRERNRELNAEFDEWTRRKWKEHKERKEEKRSREVTDYGYDLPSSYRYVKPEKDTIEEWYEELPPDPPEKNKQIEKMVNFILRKWDTKFNILKFLFPIFSILLLIFGGYVMRHSLIDGVPVTSNQWVTLMTIFFIFIVIPVDLVILLIKKIVVACLKTFYLDIELEEETKGSLEVVEKKEDLHNDIQYAEESDFEDDGFATSKVSNDVPELKEIFNDNVADAVPTEETKDISEVREKSYEQIQENYTPKIIPKKKKAPFNVEAFAKECNAYMVKLERQEEQEKLLK